MAVQHTAQPHIVMTDSGSGPQAVIARNGFKVRVLAELHAYAGIPVADIVNEYGLSDAEVHAALCFYYDHKSEIDERIRELNREMPVPS